jgi:hypothetical protein
MELLVSGREAFRAAAGLGNGPECSAGGAKSETSAASSRFRAVSFRVRLSPVSHGSETFRRFAQVMRPLPLFTVSRPIPVCAPVTGKTGLLI